MFMVTYEQGFKLVTLDYVMWGLNKHHKINKHQWEVNVYGPLIAFLIVLTYWELALWTRF